MRLWQVLSYVMMVSQEDDNAGKSGGSEKFRLLAAVYPTVYFVREKNALDFGWLLQGTDWGLGRIGPCLDHHLFSSHVGPANSGETVTLEEY